MKKDEKAKSRDTDEKSQAETSGDSTEEKEKDKEKADPKEAVPTFDEDFEENLNLGSNGWRGPVIAIACFALAAILLFAVVLMGDDEPIEDQEQDPVAVPTEPQEEDDLFAEPSFEEEEIAAVEEEDPLLEEAEELEEEEGAGLDSDEARQLAKQKGISAEIAALDMTEFIDLHSEPVDDEEAELLDEEAEALAMETEEEQVPVEAEPQPEPEPAQEPDPEPAQPSLADEKQRLRTLVQQEAGEAVSLASQLSNRAPNDGEIAYLYGRAALDASDFGRAVQELQRAEGLGIQSGDLYLDLATAYQLTGQRADAQQAYETFLEVEPEGSRANEVRNILENHF